MAAKAKRNRFFADVLSATAPSRGAASATSIPARELAKPSRAVLMDASTPALQYSLNMTGKNPAMTVVAKAEFPQS